MLDIYLREQEAPTTLLMKSIKNNKLVQAYLFYSNDINYIFNYAKEFSKELITLNLVDKKDSICEKIDKNIYSELKIVETTSNFIRKDQLIELQNSVKNKPVEGSKIVYIIKNCEKLNAASANSILKFLEEPEDNIVAILLTDNIDNVLPTIKSRCQIINFSRKDNIEDEDSYQILKNIYDENNLYKYEDFKNIVDNIIDFTINLEFKKNNTFIYIKKIWDNFNSQVYFNILISIMIYIYMDVLYIKIEKNIKYMKAFEENIIKISENNSLNDIINKIYILQKVKYESTYNVNIKLLIDKIIVELGEI